MYLPYMPDMHTGTVAAARAHGHAGLGLMYLPYVLALYVGLMNLPYVPDMHTGTVAAARAGGHTDHEGEIGDADR